MSIFWNLEKHQEPPSGWFTLWKNTVWDHHDAVFCFCDSSLYRSYVTPYVGVVQAQIMTLQLPLPILPAIHSVAARTEAEERSRPPGRRPSRPQMWPTRHFLTWVWKMSWSCSYSSSLWLSSLLSPWSMPYLCSEQVGVTAAVQRKRGKKKKMFYHLFFLFCGTDEM